MYIEVCLTKNHFEVQQLQLYVYVVCIGIFAYAFFCGRFFENHHLDLYIMLAQNVDYKIIKFFSYNIIVYL